MKNKDLKLIAAPKIGTCTTCGLFVYNYGVGYCCDECGKMVDANPL